MSGHMTSRRGIERRAVDRPPWNKVCEDLPDTGDRPNTETATGSITGSNQEGGFAFAVQPHREVRPESGLVGIVEHIVVNKR